MRRSHAAYFKCETEGCGAYVACEKASRAARVEGRDRYAPGDGCQNKTCSKFYQKGRFTDTQNNIAEQMAKGNAALVECQRIVPPVNREQRKQPIQHKRI